jgi:hypothetical protein
MNQARWFARMTGSLNLLVKEIEISNEFELIFCQNKTLNYL